MGALKSENTRLTALLQGAAGDRATNQSSDASNAGEWAAERLRLKGSVVEMGQERDELARRLRSFDDLSTRLDQLRGENEAALQRGADLEAQLQKAREALHAVKREREVSASTQLDKCMGLEREIDHRVEETSHLRARVAELSLKAEEVNQLRSTLMNRERSAVASAVVRGRNESLDRISSLQGELLQLRLSSGDPGVPGLKLSNYSTYVHIW